MKTKTKFFMSLLLVLALTITSCSKEGDIGPAGPAGTTGAAGPAGQDGEDGEALGLPGPKGDTGATGEDGADGEDGEDGNANVITSAWIPVTFETFVVTEVFNIDSDLFPEDVRDSYAVLVYIKGVNFADAVHPLPADFGTFNIYYAFLSDDTLRIIYNEESGSTASAPTNASVRYVLIKANDSSGKSSNNIIEDMKSSGVDTNDYHAVMDYLDVYH